LPEVADAAEGSLRGDGSVDGRDVVVSGVPLWRTSNNCFYVKTCRKELKNLHDSEKSLIFAASEMTNPVFSAWE